MCGGTATVPMAGMTLIPSGLSPRVRGNQLLGIHCHRKDMRSIPACAGEPLGKRAESVQSMPKVYPRVCGGTVHIDLASCF